MESVSDNKHFADSYIVPFRLKDQKNYSTQNAILLYFLLFMSSSTIPLVLCWLTKFNQYRLRRQGTRNSVSNSLILSAILQSWMLFLYLYCYQFWGLSLFKDFLLSRNAVISTAYMPFVDIGYYAVGIMGVFYLVEFPFLLWYISTKVMAMDRRGLNRRQCMLYMLKSVGCAGMVLFMQVASWYFTYLMILFLAYPLIVIALLATFLITFILLIASTALLLLPCITRCRRCPQQSGPIVFLILAVLICLAYTYYLWRTLKATWSESYSASQILSGMLSSGMLVLLTYIFKVVITQYMLSSDSQTNTDDENEQMLLPEGTNP